MTTIRTILMGLGFLFVALVFCSAVYAGEDAVSVAPDNNKVLLENENVRVIEYTAKAGEKVGMHSHPNHVIYVLTGGKTKFLSEDGKSEERDTKTGETLWVPATTHGTEHIDDIRVIIVELKK